MVGLQTTGKTLKEMQSSNSFDDGLERVYGWFTDNWENIERDAEF